VGGASGGEGGLCFLSSVLGGGCITDVVEVATTVIVAVDVETTLSVTSIFSTEDFLLECFVVVVVVFDLSLEDTLLLSLRSLPPEFNAGAETRLLAASIEG